jgi:hypothetical protein
MSKQSYFKMDNLTALELIKEWIKPGGIPLGIPFAWQQPEKDETINLQEELFGTAEQEINLEEKGVLSYKRVNQYNTYQWKINFPKGFDFRFADDVKEYFDKWIIKENKNNEFANFILHPKGLYSVSIAKKWSELELEEKLKLRLAILAINTMTDYHNWAIATFQEIAEYYCNNYPKDLTYQYDGELDDEFLQQLLDWGLLQGEIYFNCGESDETYYYTNKFKDELDISWLEEMDEISYDVLEKVFSYDIPQENPVIAKYSHYLKEEMFYLLAWFVDWIKDEWQSGNLELMNPESIDNQIIKNFIISYQAQELLPGFEIIGEKEND